MPVCGTILAAIYLVAWHAPGIGLAQEDGGLLVQARLLLAGNFPRANPPLFPALLALFAAVSDNAQWLKTLPLLCAAGWLAVTHKAMRQMGAGRRSAGLIAGLTAAAPAVIFAATNLLPETLFALLIAATLAALLEDRTFLAGTFAGLATLTEEAGVALIVACVLILVARGRFRGAVRFACASMILTAPWFGWSLAHALPGPPGNIAAGLRASEKLVVVGANVISLFTGPFELVTGIGSAYAALGTGVLLLWALVKRRQAIPDFFLALYSLTLLCLIRKPERALISILPLFLWILWRVFHKVRRREAFAAALLILGTLAFASDLRRTLFAAHTGAFPPSNHITNDWAQMEKMFEWIRGNTTADALVLADLDGAFYLNTGRRTLRGFPPDKFRVEYAPSLSAVTPDQLSNAIMTDGVTIVALTPDRNLPESAAFHRSVEALERGGILEPLTVPGLRPEYRLLHTARLSFRR